MARLRKDRGGAITLAGVLVLLSLTGSFAAAQSLYERPILVVEPGMHTAKIFSAATDVAGRFIATASEDKTVRIWSVSNGNLLRTIRMPAGPGTVGKVYAVAVSPDGGLVAAAGWMESPAGGSVFPIYLFDPSTGEMKARIADNLPEVTLHLAFSADGRYLAATLGSNEGLRVFDREKNWSQIFRDTDYAARSYGAAFASDGRLATTSDDGKIRLYDSSFGLAASQEALRGQVPRKLAFSPDGDLLVLGYHDAPLVDLLDGHTLARLPEPNTANLNDGGNLDSVAWSGDGKALFAGGTYPISGTTLLLAWDGVAWVNRRGMSICADTSNTIMDIVPLPADQLLIATADPCLTLLSSNADARWVHGRPGADPRGQQRSLAVSADGQIIDFAFDAFGKSPLRFDVRALTLSGNPAADDVTRPPVQEGLTVQDWNSAYHTKVNGKPVELEDREMSRSLAIHPDGRRFVLGTIWMLRAFDADGKALWNSSAPGDALAVNIAGDGRVVVAAHADGTVRWYRMDNGRELLALYVLADKKNWVAWTPEGFYAATPGAYGVLRWQINRGISSAADTVQVSDIPKLKRPDAVQFILQELETARALGIADLAAARRDVQVATGAAKPPGARLHVLTIGINSYGDKAKFLHLKFAGKDANDLANALVNTQSSDFNKVGGLYAEVLPQYLHDGTADKSGIYRAFATMQSNMAKGNAGQDLAVVMFSGHGAMLDNRFYLLPYGVDASTPDQIEASAISADDFEAKVKNLAQYGRVLLLLDACHSGAAANGAKFSPNADLLRSVMASSNVTVLTSSSAAEPSREDDAWGNGAFTKVLIEALGKDADENHDGLISLSEMIDYVSRRLSRLTGDHQHLGIEHRFEGDLFVAGL